MRISVTPTLEIESFSGGEITVASSLVTNGIFSKRSDGNPFITQRPSINVVEDASATVTNAHGRGVYYWTAATSTYFVNDAIVYSTDYSAPVNEASVTVTDLDGDGTTATATAAAHGYKAGDKVTIAGATDTVFNGYVTLLTVADADHFTYAAATSTTNDSGTSVRGLGGGGTDRVYFAEIGNYLVIIDPADNTGWYVNISAPLVLVEITDTDFPGVHSSGGFSLAKGRAVLDGTLYVMDTTGTIAGSEIEDPTSWEGLNIIDAEIEQDGGVLLEKHRNHVVAFGNRTIEFFYDAQNPTGSPLAVRQDISHEIGLVNSDTVWNDKNTLFFVSQSRTGGLAVYLMSEFMPQVISTYDIDSFLTSSVYTDDKKLIGSGFSLGNSIFYVLTIYHVIDDIVPLESIVFNSTSGTWTRFNLVDVLSALSDGNYIVDGHGTYIVDGVEAYIISGIESNENYLVIDAHFPIIDWTVSADTRLGEGILANGDLITVADDWSPYDSFGASTGVFADDVFEIDVFTNSSQGSGTLITMEAILGDTDNGTVNRKFMPSLRLAGPKTNNSQDMLIQWSDESNNDFNAGKTLDTSIPGHRINRLGSYRQRNFKLTYAGSERIELDGLEVEINTGIY